MNNGIRGALVLGPGVYQINGTVNINKSGVVLRGSGDEADALANTILTAPGDLPHQRTVKAEHAKAFDAELLAESDPTNQGLAAAAVFMLECAGQPEMAKAYFERAGESNAKKINDFFEPLSAKE